MDTHYVSGEPTLWHDRPKEWPQVSVEPSLLHYRDTARELLALLQHAHTLYRQLQQLDAHTALPLVTSHRVDTLASCTWPKYLLRQDLAQIEAHLSAHCNLGPNEGRLCESQRKVNKGCSYGPKRFRH